MKTILYWEGVELTFVSYFGNIFIKIIFGIKCDKNSCKDDKSIIWVYERKLELE